MPRERLPFRGFVVFTPMTNATTARERAKLSLETAAKRLRISPEYLRHCERNGFSYVLADRAARLYQCSLNEFIPRKEMRKK
jgi:hypothetical protein